MKNWLPLVLGPELAMDSTPRLECSWGAFSAAEQARRNKRQHACTTARAPRAPTCTHRTIVEFVRERLAPRRLPAAPGARGVAALDLRVQPRVRRSCNNAAAAGGAERAHHEVANVAVEDHAVVVAAGAQLEEVLARARGVLAQQLTAAASTRAAPQRCKQHAPPSSVRRGWCAGERSRACA